MLQEKLSYTPKKNIGSRNVNDTYSEQKSTTQIFAALKLASIKSEVEEAQSFELLSKTQRTSSRLNRYPLQLVAIQMTLRKKKFLGARQADVKEANSLVSYTKRTLDNCRIDEDNCFSQTLNGANIKTGLAVEYSICLKNVLQVAGSLHCMNHGLNLVNDDDVCKSTKPARNSIIVLERL